jgi:aspartyl-tRNA(Asn)/glutamyl-tRNA(Gln) amidotransferase subunit A
MELVDREATTIEAASRAIADRSLSPVELLDACIACIERAEDEVKAFVTLDLDGARRQAQQLAEELTSSGPRSPLHGIPIGVKDLIDVEGLPTTASSKILAGNVAEDDAPVIQILRAAGAVILGKTNTQEFAYGVVSAPTKNPWDTGRIPGGSSGGSAAAVAAGMCPGSLGSDTAGSIRIPAALCGVSGLKPANGRLPMTGIVPLAPSLDACGPIARTAADCDLIWGALSGDDPSPATDPRRMRVGVIGSIESWMEQSPSRAADITIEPDVAAATDDAAAVLREAGAELVGLDLPGLREWDLPRSALLMVEALIVHEDAGWYPARADDYGPETVAAHRFAEKLSAATLLRSSRKLDALKADWEAVLADVDVLLLPTTPAAAPLVDETKGLDDGHRPPVTRTLTRICGPVNVCGLAAAAVPARPRPEGLPIGVQFVARTEAAVLSAARCFQSVSDWHLGN